MSLKTSICCFALKKVTFTLLFYSLCMSFSTQLNACNLTVCQLTLSSSAVRLGVRIGACGTLGSLPRLGGKGSRGRPLHMPFKEDILQSVVCHTLDEQKPEDKDRA